MNLLKYLDDDIRFGLYLCVKGGCDMVINDRPCHLVCGDVFVKSPLVQVSNLKAYDDFELVAIFEDDIEVMIPIATDNFDVVQELLRKNRFYYSTNKEEQALLLSYKNLIDKRKSELKSENISPRQHKLIGYIVALMEQTAILEFVRMFAHHSFEPEDTEKERQVMIRFFFLLFPHYKHHRQVQFYADTLNLSPNHFTRIVKKVSNRTPSEWIALITINQAKKILRQSNMSIKEVAQVLNFPEQFTFRKYFKQHTGMSPKEYKMRHLM